MSNPYESPVNTAEEARKSTTEGMGWSFFACLAAGLALAAPIPSLLEMASYPPGTAMRPMGAAAVVCVSTLGSLVIAVPFSLRGVFALRRSSRFNWFGYLALLIAILGVIGPMTMMQMVIIGGGYVMKE